MIEIIVTVELNGKHYQTNVIGYKEMSTEKIERLAKQQVFKQWGE
ncbi:BA3454 family stress response protein [Metabacillus sediminilitoris]|uniref:BA3454 family stress response protein n=1 Tax=Metabacillus sediminilitoris TaxID=2567941 RepID=A0A4S4C4G6_9BACI|nr:BA3454 family stress response protein [Metabacillus sediminilitoris]QGQ45253.1 BA3454 family stress response protein [Metabacillus sediminilitoris]THF82448.1 BA3454 family stress response protein [Metabacillus sediminilitoris]